MEAIDREGSVYHIIDRITSALETGKGSNLHLCTLLLRVDSELLERSPD